MSGKYQDLREFFVILALYGVKKEKDPGAIFHIEDELKARPHILDYKVSWDQEISPVFIEVTVEGLEEQVTSKQMAEEIFEIACAVLKDIEGMHVEVKGVKRKCN